MGLSDSERLVGMCYSVASIVKEVRHWEECAKGTFDSVKYGRLKSLIEDLWHAIFGSEVNALHWIEGSSASNPISSCEPSTPWEIGVMDHCESRSSIEREYCFNALEFCDIHYLLNAVNTSAASVFNIYAAAESLAYYLRRYDDAFLKKYTYLSKVLSNIFGECFTIFTDDLIYAKAYLIHQIMEILYIPPYPYQPEQRDIVVKILDKHNIHHCMPKLMHNPLQDIIEDHKSLEIVRTRAMWRAQKRGEMHKWGLDQDLLKARLFAVLELESDIYKYEHVFRSVADMIEESGLWVDEAKKKMEEVKNRIKEKEEMREANSNYLLSNNNLNVYGVADDSIRQALSDPEEEKR